MHLTHKCNFSLPCSTSIVNVLWTETDAQICWTTIRLAAPNRNKNWEYLVVDSGGKINGADRYASVLEERISRQLHFINALTMKRCDTYLAVRFLHIMQNELVVLRRQGRLFSRNRELRRSASRAMGAEEVGFPPSGMPSDRS